jgi:hypothetical protein
MRHTAVTVGYLDRDAVTIFYLTREAAALAAGVAITHWPCGYFELARPGVPPMLIAAPTDLGGQRDSLERGLYAFARITRPQAAQAYQLPTSYEDELPAGEDWR